MLIHGKEIHRDSPGWIDEVSDIIADCKREGRINDLSHVAHQLLTELVKLHCDVQVGDIQLGNRPLTYHPCIKQIEFNWVNGEPTGYWHASALFVYDDRRVEVTEYANSVQGVIGCVNKTVEELVGKIDAGLKIGVPVKQPEKVATEEPNPKSLLSTLSELEDANDIDDDIRMITQLIDQHVDGNYIDVKRLYKLFERICLRQRCMYKSLDSISDRLLEVESIVTPVT